MRTLLAIVIAVVWVFAFGPTASAQTKFKRSAQPVSVQCQRALNEDPAGQFAGYPCWAREMFGRGTGSGGGMN
jgi:hypothetical protein